LYISGGNSRSQWEDITGSAPVNLLKDSVSFSTTVSARFAFVMYIVVIACLFHSDILCAGTRSILLLFVHEYVQLERLPNAILFWDISSPVSWAFHMSWSKCCLGVWMSGC